MGSLGINVTLDHKTSHKCQFLEIEIYTPSESWINKLSIDVWFKVVQMKVLAMHITNQKLSLDIFTVLYLLNIFMEHDLYLMS